MTSILQTLPMWDAYLPTHLATFHVSTGQYQGPQVAPARGIPQPPPRPPHGNTYIQPRNQVLVPPRITTATLPLKDANRHYIQSAGLSVGHEDENIADDDLARDLARTPKGRSKAWFIDVGGHAIATFAVGEDIARYETKGRLYWFDPNFGCFFADGEDTYKDQFNGLKQRFSTRVKDIWWYCSVRDLTTKSQEVDMDVSSLFS